jgi:glutamate N-acetyltransferase / amino-acid N-acetyltransferase
MNRHKMNNNTITAPAGFFAAGVKSGIKASGKEDVGVIYCPEGAKAAAVFTTNKVVSAAVEVCRRNLTARSTLAVVVNSGNANTCTGIKGEKDALQMCGTLAGELGCSAENILIASTGIIGRPLPMDKVIGGIKAAASQMSESETAGHSFARAILTTDTVEKNAVEKFNLGAAAITIAGTVKGAGMISPNMATTLCFLTTDINISRPLLQKALRSAIGCSLNKLTVDGHQSTNDTAILLSSSKAGNKMIKKTGADFDKFVKALRIVCESLAKQMAMDAEGATRIFKVLIKGAATAKDAAKAARAIADYDLVKCAVHGGDPNWGRIICAAGSCGVKIDKDKLTCKLDKLTVFKNGKPTRFDVAKASEIVSAPEHTITVELGAGKYQDYCYGCDLSRDYVTINADYHT